MKKLLCLLLVAVLYSAQSVFAAPANTTPKSYTLPDGTEITVRTHGDEWEHWTASEDGFTLLFNTDGFLEYAVQDEAGRLKLSGIRAHNADERTADEQDFVNTLSKHLRYSASQKEAMNKVRGVREEARKKALFDKTPRNLVGTIRFPVVLIEFTDVKLTYTKEDFELLFNQENYTTGRATGSLHDYFRDNSYGKMDLQVDVFGPYAMPKTIVAYGIDKCSTYPPNPNPLEMVRTAIESADNDGADFSNYVLQGRDTVNTIHIIYAGYGLQEDQLGLQCRAIWAHAGSLNAPVEYDGVFLQNYSCSSELRGSSGNSIMGIGTMAHELGHALVGVPDFYDANYETDGLSAHVGMWCVMGEGNQLNSGLTPPNYSAYVRSFAGWIKETMLTEVSDIVLPNPVDSGVVYRINTQTENEYFLIENRQKAGWDAYIPGSGLMIYHVDGNHKGWFDNTLNNSPTNRGYYVKQAGCDNPNGCTSNRGTDAWPQGDKMAFTDTTMPNAKSKAGANTEQPISKIRINTINRTVSFKFLGGIIPTSNNIVLNDIQLPELRLDEGDQTIKVNVENRGLDINSMLFTWHINGDAQTPYEWTGTLPYEDFAEITIGTANLTRGTHRINVTVTINNDSLPENNTMSKEITVQLPFMTEDFEGETSDWHFANGTQTNQWHVGADLASEGEKSLYISNNNGDTNLYTTNKVSMVHVYRDVEFPTSTKNFDLYFDFKGMGQQNASGTESRDYMEIRIMGTDVTPQDSIAMTAGDSLGRYVNQSTWQNNHLTLSPTYSGTTKRLMFSWYNNATLGTQSPAAVDNIIITTRPDLPTLHSIVLSSNGTNVFDSVMVGYEAPDVLTVAITNIGTEATGELTIALSGEHADKFTLSTATVASVGINGNELFTVERTMDLDAGIYTATVTVSGDNEISASFEVSFTVVSKNDDAAIEMPTLAKEVLKVHPNPVFDDKLVVEIPNNVDSKAVEIYTLSGKLMLTQAVNRPKTELNLSHLSKGMYIVKTGGVSAMVLKQ
ncbi:MAG: M6 family metalloprotease domain-containing protein [Bacteroidales bacterium]|jgi:M6 family metalloprotease-like protein|nr:M6 family metalloprotease domain-containing protein [Bacteroidales bacterium]